MREKIAKVLHDALDLNLAHLTGRQMVEDGTVAQGLAAAVLDAMMEPTQEQMRAAREAPLPLVHLDSISGRQDLENKTVWKAMLAAASAKGEGE